MPADVSKILFTCGAILLLAMAGTASAQTIRRPSEAIRLAAMPTVSPEAPKLNSTPDSATGTEANPQTEEVIVVVDETGHRWRACGSETEMSAQRAAHEGHGHNHEFYGPCLGTGLLVDDSATADGSEGSDGAAASEDGMAEPDIDTGDCVASDTGPTSTNCQTARTRMGLQIRQQLRDRLPLLTPALPPAGKDEDNEN